MGENYTRKTENYAPRQDRNQNSQGSQQMQKPTTTVYTCWRCHMSFELSGSQHQDTVRCPYCEMIHGKITTK